MAGLSDRIRAVLADLHLSQSEFARTIGISFTYVNLIINNKRMTISDLFAGIIQEKYGYSADWILTGQGDKKIEDDLEDILFRIRRMSRDEINLVLNYAILLEHQQLSAAKKSCRKNRLIGRGDAGSPSTGASSTKCRTG
jgi:transcriptional regulator with XRE-family HTH domain